MIYCTVPQWGYLAEGRVLYAAVIINAFMLFSNQTRWDLYLF